MAIEPVVDVRQKPVDCAEKNIHDDLEETQVLYNEPLLYKGENEEWYLAEAVEQDEFSHHGVWEGYPGWVRKASVKPVANVLEYNSVVKNKAVPIYSAPDASGSVLITVSAGSRFKITGEKSQYYEVCLPDNAAGWIKKDDLSKFEAKLSSAEIRNNIVSAAYVFLGAPYYWGGRSVSGVDCSGLTSLAYRLNNIPIPRDAQEQWMISEKISPERLKTADLIFISAKDNFFKITHVMLYLEGERFIEASGTGNVVGIKTFREKLGVNLSELIMRDFIVEGKKIYFGRIEFDERLLY